MNSNNVFDRISAIVSLMISNAVSGTSFTLVDISRELGCSLQLVRNDVAIMAYTMPFMEAMLTDSDDFIEAEPDAILKGAIDDTVICFRSYDLFEEESYLVFFSKFEKVIIDKWFDGFTPFYDIKKSVNDISDEIKEKINIINKAIIYGTRVQFDYLNTDGQYNRLIVVTPKDFRVNSENPSDVRMITSAGNIFTISGMENIKLTREKEALHESSDSYEDWDSLWGLPSPKGSREAGKYHVKLEIRETDGNLSAKIKADTERRQNKKWLKLSDNISIYEDDVSGFHDFKRWIMGYGSRIKVIEPEWLAKDIMSEFETMAIQYKQGYFDISK